MCEKRELKQWPKKRKALALTLILPNNFFLGINGVNATGIDQGYQRQNVCSPDPCVNGACKDLWTRYSCECDRYWTSTNCTERKLITILRMLRSYHDLKCNH